MNRMKIQLNGTADVREFVSAAEKCDFDVDIQYESTVVDAKSILGIISLGLAKIMTVYCHGEDPDFVNRIQKFAVA
ncbi:MAG: HPr family phosphocarrier protein [Eubacteriales bacterium]|nr:HPr family phosphocarrier protein [Eubacteriales bacterium]